MRVFLIFTRPTADGFCDYFRHSSARHVDGTTVVVVDNDSAPELEGTLQSIADTMNDTDRGGSKVHRIERTPLWKIAEDILVGSAAASVTEPTVIVAADRFEAELRCGVGTDLIGPVGRVSESFVFTSSPVELVATLNARTKGWPTKSLFAPATTVTASGVTHVPPLGNVAALLYADAQGHREVREAKRPDGVHESLVRMYHEALGDDAAEFLVRLQTASQIADDFVDGAVARQWRSDAMRELLEITLLEVPNHPFYVANKAALEEVVAQCITVWHLANGLESCTTPESRMWCFVQREAFQMVVWRVAVIVGGLALGRDVLRRLQQALHGPNGGAKKFPAWLEEARARTCRG